MQISGIFSLVVALLLVINFLQMRKYEPLESATLNALVERLEEHPGDEKLMAEIREFDLLVRKAYFTNQWQINTGALLLIIGTVIFAIALYVYTDLRRKIEKPEPEREELKRSRELAVRWLGIVGGVIFLLALSSAWVSKNYLVAYYAGSDPATSTTAESEDESIEVVTLTEPGGTTPGSATSGSSSGQSAGPGNVNPESADPLSDDVNHSRSSRSTGGNSSENNTANITSDGESASVQEEIHGIEMLKKQHSSFRGPLGQGISYHRNIPTEWDGASGNNVIWKVALSKPGYNSPVIWGDRLFLTGADNTARIVSCFNSKSGELLWERAADNIPGSPSTMPKVTDDTGLAAPTVATDGYRVYAIFATGDIIAFSMNGERAWARNLGVPRNHYGHSSSLLVWNNKVIVQYDTGSGGRMLALAAQSGETVWDIRRDNNISWASPVLVNYAGEMQVVTNTDPLVAGYDVETGNEIWKLSVMMGEVGPSVAYDDGLVFANNEYASLVAINPEPGAAVVWENYDYLSEAASPVAFDGKLYLATSYGVLVCYDTKTGDQLWELDFGSQIYSSPMIAEGRVYLMDNSGVMHIVKADASGTVISEPALGEASYAVPAFADGRIYIRGSESLYCIGK